MLRCKTVNCFMWLHVHIRHCLKKSLFKIRLGRSKFPDPPTPFVYYPQGCRGTCLARLEDRKLGGGRNGDRAVTGRLRPVRPKGHHGNPEIGRISCMYWIILHELVHRTWGLWQTSLCLSFIATVVVSLIKGLPVGVEWQRSTYSNDVWRLVAGVPVGVSKYAEIFIVSSNHQTGAYDGKWW